MAAARPRPPARTPAISARTRLLVRMLGMKQPLRVAVAACLLLAAGPLRAAPITPEQSTFAPNLEVVDVPTASTLFARMFHMNFRAFRGGGIMMKATASFNNSLSLGLGLKANNVIGNGNVSFDDQPVAAVAKIGLIALPRLGLTTAIGYDGLAYDVTRQKGVYGVVTKDLDAAGLVFRAHGGAGAVRFRNFNSKTDINVFAAVDAALSTEIFLGAEYDDMTWHHGSFNVAGGYAWDVGLRLELDFKSLFRGVKNHYRVLKILYTF